MLLTFLRKLAGSFYQVIVNVSIYVYLFLTASDFRMRENRDFINKCQPSFVILTSNA